MKSSNNWYQSIVTTGNQQGRTLGFPTLNLDTSVLPKDQKEGVYKTSVKYNGKTYTGALYVGPRIVLGETQKVLEIYVLDFSQDLYGKSIEFQIQNFIRDVQNFSTLAEMQKQIEADIKKIKSLTI